MKTYFCRMVQIPTGQTFPYPDGATGDACTYGKKTTVREVIQPEQVQEVMRFARVQPVPEVLLSRSLSSNP